jgi:hypothetical protein
MSKSKKWFIKKRGSYLPRAWQGWLLYIPFIGYLISTFILFNRQSNSVSAVLYGIVPQWVAATVILTWIAQQKS